MFLESVRAVGGLAPKPFGVKLHMLNVIRGTALERWYHEGGRLMPRAEYIGTMIRALELLPPETVILRLGADAPEENLIAPDYVRKKFTLSNDIDKEMRRMGTYQGLHSGYKYIKDEEANVCDETNEYRKRTSLTNILSAAKRFFDLSVKDGGTYIDFTMGNGHDTVYMAKKCVSGKVYSFDIQPEALDVTRERLNSELPGWDNVSLICDSHDNFERYIGQNTALDGGIFNLGYRPGGDRKVTTRLDSTMTALRKAVTRLSVGGVIVVVVYSGHEEGVREGQAVLDFAEKQDRGSYDCLLHRLVNIPDAPYIAAFWRKRGKLGMRN
jgi:hypothetical protein